MLKSILKKKKKQEVPEIPEKQVKFKEEAQIILVESFKLTQEEKM